jgi:DHA1 family bicyclomycin/chloramphenicol resistance-like MFS transporter
MKIQPASFAFTLLVASLAWLPPLSTDMMLPALPVIGAALGVPPASAGYAISFFFIGFSLAQLVFGPCSDRYGRRPVGLLGCTLFAVAGFGCTFAGSLPALLAWRVAQGVGAGAGAVLAFAIVRDSFSGAAARTRFAYVNVCMAFGPMLAPSLGAVVFGWWGWRAIFGMLAGAGVLLVSMLALLFAESLPPERRISLAPAAVARNYWTVITNRVVLGYALVGTFVFGAMMAYVTLSPYVFINRLGMDRTRYGLVFVGTSCGLMAGSSLAGWLGHRFQVADRPLLTAGLLLALAATAGLLLATWSGCFTAAVAIPLLMLATLAVGLTSPTVAHGVLAPMGALAGTATAAMGGLRMVGGAISSAVASSAGGGTATGMAAVMLASTLLALLAYLALVCPNSGQ